MPTPFPTDGATVLQRLVKDVDRLKRLTNGRGADADQTVDGETITIPQANVTDGAEFYLDVLMDENVASVGQQVYNDNETILTDSELWVVMPSTPICSTTASTVSVEWDGFGPEGELVPSNFVRLAVHRSLDPDFDADPLVTQVGVMTLPGALVFSDQAIGTSYFYRFVLHTADGRRSQQSDIGEGIAAPIGMDDLDPDTIDDIQQGAVDEAKAYTDSVIGSATGAQIHYSVLPPGSTANAVGDIWFQRDATSGAIVGQWFGAGGTTWDETTLSHEVISSVDLGTATVGKLSADYIDTGNLSSDVTVTGTLLAGDPAGGYMTFDSAGFKQFTSPGALSIFFPNDPTVPAQFEGRILSQSLTNTDYLTIQGRNNVIAQASELRLAAGVLTPASPVSVSVGYSTYDTTRWTSGSLFIPNGVHGNVDDTADVYAAMGVYGYGKMLGPAARRYTFPEVTNAAGDKRSTYSFSSAVMIHTAAGAERMVTMGSRCAANGDTPASFIVLWDPATMTSGGTVPPAEKVRMTTKADDYVYETRLGRVFSGVGSTTLKEQFCAGYGDWLGSTIKLGRWTATDTGFTLVGGAYQTVTSPLASGETFAGVTYGDAAKMAYPGTTLNLWLIHGSVNTYAYNASTLARLPDYDFPTPAGMSRVFAWGNVATNEFLGFRTVVWSDSSPVTKLTNNHWVSPTSNKWWVSSTWYDPDVTGSTHETTQGNRTQVTMVKRAGLTYTVPTYPERPFPTTTDDVTSARVYVGKGATDPTRTGMDLIVTLNSPNRSGYLGTYTPPGTLVNPPLTNNFPQSAAAKISSADGARWVMLGDGSAIIGPITITKDPASVSTIVGNWNAYLGATDSTVQNLIEWRQLAVSGGIKFRNRNYLANEGGTSVAKVSLFYEDDVEVYRTHYYADGRGFAVRDTRNGGKWSYLRGDGVLSQYMRTIEYAYSDATNFNTSLVAYNDCNLRGGRGTFVVPPSGAVRLDWMVVCRTAVAGDPATCDVEVRTGATIGSGTVVRTPNVQDSARNYNTQFTTVGYSAFLTGLTAGATYNARMMYASFVAGTTCNFAQGRLMITPLM